MEKLIIFIIFGIIFTSEAQKSFKDHKVVSLQIENHSQLTELQSLEIEQGYVFLDPPVQVHMNLDLVISPENFEFFKEFAENYNIKFDITSTNLQSAIDIERPLKNRKEGFSFDKFNLLDDIYKFLNETETAHSEKARLITIGESFEGRPLQLMKISLNENNPAIFIEANIHAREWISSATALWIINEILTTSNPEVRDVIDGISWYILPVTNPDGYQYTHDTDRLWRKTRSIHNIFCRGADPNRNFGFNWRLGGSSRVPCTDTYSGPKAFSEKETKALMDFYDTIYKKVEIYLAFHSAAQLLLYPLGHQAPEEAVPNKEDLHEIASAAVTALEARNNIKYGFGNVIEELYVASGSSPDHVYGVYNTSLAYTYEFRTGIGTASRFILPPEEIIPNSEEVFDSILAMIAKAKKLGYFEI